MKKIKIYSEIIYILAIIFLALSINIMDKANLGLSMIVAPAYIISQKFSFLSYGQAEYLFAGLDFILFCFIMKIFKIAYLSSFITGIAYGTCADIIKTMIPFFQETTPLDLHIRILLFIVGMCLTALAVSLFFSTYFYPQIYDFFVDRVSKKFNIPLRTFKTGNDIVFLIISIILSYVLFSHLVGIHIGTLIMALLNGTLINFFKMTLANHIEFIPYFNKLSQYLENN